MKPQNLISYFTLVLLSVSVVSCNFLTENPWSELPETDVITSADALYNNAVAALYTNIGGNTEGVGLQGTYRGVYDLQTFTSDEAMIPTRGGDWYDGGLWQALYQHTWTTDNEAVENAWKYLYKVVVQCNHSLELLSTYSSFLSETEQQACEAEVRALRAVYYWYLLDLYGNVPLVTSSKTKMNEVESSSRSEVFRFTVNELQEVLPYLSASKSNTLGSYYGHVTQPVAEFVMMKLALNAEIYSDDDPTDNIHPDGKSLLFLCGTDSLNAWQTVVYYASLIKSAGYELDTEQPECFAVNNENSRENIFTIPMDKSLYLSRFRNQFRSLHYQHAGALGYGGENGSCATLETLAAFGYGTTSVDNRFFLSFYSDTVYVNSTPLVLANGDTLVYQADKVQLDLTGSQYIATAGARMAKYDIESTGIFDCTLRQNDIVLFRYADVLLMIAEAKVRNGDDGSAELNMLRTRVAMPPIEPTLQNIYDERKRELVWEGWRRQDMIRFGTFTREYSFRPQLSGETSNGGYTTLFPIPQSAIEMNPKLTQNKGY